MRHMNPLKDSSIHIIKIPEEKKEEKIRKEAIYEVIIIKNFVVLIDVKPLLLTT